uniref:Uncharacterized protein n=1 Tax=Myotis myotis TaxID=51298 RepID=A0A7J7Z6H2_MYOMY|nr:hypothetical protein mMyoMyo1_010666 [Myotis myotis]
MGGHRPGGMRARFQKCLLSAYYAHGTLRRKRLIMNIKDTNPCLLGLFSGRVSPGPWACLVSGSQTARCSQPRAARLPPPDGARRPGRRRFPPGACLHWGAAAAVPPAACNLPPLPPAPPRLRIPQA